VTIWKLSMGSQYFSNTVLAQMARLRVVSVHPDTRSKGTSNDTQGKNFLEAKRGDLFYLCISNERIVNIGIFTDDMPFFSNLAEHTDWVERSYEPLFTATNPENYNKELDKWWTPRNNSTFIEIPENSYSDFEVHFLSPAFGITLENLISARLNYLRSFSMDDVIKIQKRICKLNSEPVYLYSELNNLDNQTLGKIKYSLAAKEGPVIQLRKNIVAQLIAKQNPVTANDIQRYKEDIDPNSTKGAFKMWKRDYSVLFPFFYETEREKVKKSLEEFANNLQNDLNIQDSTKIKIVDLYGPRYQGSTELWVAIYNSKHKDQTTAHQLFFYINEHQKIEYGLYHHVLKDRANLSVSNVFDYQTILAKMRQYVSIILTDDPDKNAKQYAYWDLLEKNMNLILTGAPGTGKTWLAREIAKQMTGDTNNNLGRIGFVQFHPSYDYTDFVEGIKPTSLAGGTVQLKVRDGVFMEFCKKASCDSEDNRYVFIIDEINRAE